MTWTQDGEICSHTCPDWQDSFKHITTSMAQVGILHSPQETRPNPNLHLTWYLSWSLILLLICSSWPHPVPEIWYTLVLSCLMTLAPNCNSASLSWKKYFVKNIYNPNLLTYWYTVGRRVNRLFGRQFGSCCPVISLLGIYSIYYSCVCSKLHLKECALQYCLY